jgi:hypothetical protein
MGSGSIDYRQKSISNWFLLFNSNCGVLVMYEEKRKGEKAIPDNVNDYLNDMQQMILKNIDRLGWSLRFVRRSSGELPIAVIGDKEGNRFGVLEESGSVDFETGIMFRANLEFKSVGGRSL